MLLRCCKMEWQSAIALDRALWKRLFVVASKVNNDESY